MLPHETATGIQQSVLSVKTSRDNMSDKVTDNDRAEKRKNFVYSVLIGQDVLVTVCCLYQDRSFAEFQCILMNSCIIDDGRGKI